MTLSNVASNTQLAANTDDLPRPDAVSDGTSSDAIVNSAQPRGLPNVVDSGRISFGAAMRLPLSK